MLPQSRRRGSLKLEKTQREIRDAERKNRKKRFITSTEHNNLRNGKFQKNLDKIDWNKLRKSTRA